MLTQAAITFSFLIIVICCHIQSHIQSRFIQIIIIFCYPQLLRPTTKTIRCLPSLSACLTRGRLPLHPDRICFSSAEAKHKQQLSHWLDSWWSYSAQIIRDAPTLQNFFQLGLCFFTLVFASALLWHCVHFATLFWWWILFFFSTINFYFLGLSFRSFELCLCQDQGLHDPVVLALQHPSIYYQLSLLHFQTSIHFRSGSTALLPSCWTQLTSTPVLAVSVSLPVSV